MLPRARFLYALSACGVRVMAIDGEMNGLKEHTQRVARRSVRSFRAA